ncbi:hypothetical protein EMIT0196P_200039 [Pseudomonas chlororaphis]
MGEIEVASSLERRPGGKLCLCDKYLQKNHFPIKTTPSPPCAGAMTAGSPADPCMFSGFRTWIATCKSYGERLG